MAAQLAPQRSTQYADLVKQLAPYELDLSVVGARVVESVTPMQLGSHEYLTFQVDREPDATMLHAMGNLAMTDACFVFHEQIGDVKGPFLEPVDTPVHYVLPKDLVYTRRYRGKTNELFTTFMCNVAHYSSDYRATPWNKLTLLDPLSGGGTTLFIGLTRGADVVGVERNRTVVEGTAAFLKQYTKEARISAKFREDRLKNMGKRWFITFGNAGRCVIGLGDTNDVHAYVNGLKRPQLIVTDLPYGIQHRAEWKTMLVSALPAWADVLAKGGVLAFSWNASGFSREDMIALVEEVSDFKVLNTPPYNQLAHRVDRVIKRRDVVVARVG